MRLGQSISNDDANHSETKEEASVQPEPPRDNPPTLPPNLQDMHLGRLSQDQKNKGMKMLLEEADSFATGDLDIGSIENLKMDIKLIDSTPA